MLKTNPVGRPMKKKAPKVKVLISCFPEHVENIKEFVKKLNMKKLLIIFAIALSSCTTEEPKGCDCLGIFRLDGQQDLNVFYMQVEIECGTTNLISEIPDNYQFWGCKK
jgi:hypothetical protein